MLNMVSELRALDQLRGDADLCIRVPGNLDEWTTDLECYHVMTFDTGGIHYGPRERTSQWNKRWSYNRFLTEFLPTGAMGSPSMYNKARSLYFHVMKQELDNDKFRRMKQMHSQRLRCHTKMGEDKLLKYNVRAERSASILKASVHKAIELNIKRRNERVMGEALAVHRNKTQRLEKALLKKFHDKAKVQAAITLNQQNRMLQMQGNSLVVHRNLLHGVHKELAAITTRKVVVRVKPLS